MLPPNLRCLRDSLLGENSLRTDRRRLLSELQELDEALEFPDGAAIRRLRERIESASEPHLEPGSDEHCPLCGR